MLEHLVIVSLETVRSNVAASNITRKRLHLGAQNDMDITSHASCIVLNQIVLEISVGVFSGRNDWNSV